MFVLLLVIVQGRGESENSNGRSLHDSLLDQADKTKEHPPYHSSRCPVLIVSFLCSNSVHNHRNARQADKETRE